MGCFPGKLGFWTGSFFHQILISIIISNSSVCKFQRGLQYWNNLWGWRESTSEEQNPKSLTCFTWPEQFHQETQMLPLLTTLLSVMYRSQNSIRKLSKPWQNVADCSETRFGILLSTGLHNLQKRAFVKRWLPASLFLIPHLWPSQLLWHTCQTAHYFIMSSSVQNMGISSM